MNSMETFFGQWDFRTIWIWGSGWPFDLGSLRLWGLWNLGPLDLETMDFCTIGIWGHGTLEPGDFGTLGPLDCGKVKDRSGLSTCHGSGRRCRVRSHYLSPMGLHEQGVYRLCICLLWGTLAPNGFLRLSVTRSKLRSKRSKPAICRS